jgi:hypothetical protein
LSLDLARISILEASLFLLALNYAHEHLKNVNIT